MLIFKLLLYIKMKFCLERRFTCICFFTLHKKQLYLPKSGSFSAPSAWRCNENLDVNTFYNDILYYVYM